MKREQCVKCRKIWAVSAMRSAGKMFLCPDCEDKIMERPYRTRTNVWESKEEIG